MKKKSNLILFSSLFLLILSYSYIHIKYYLNQPITQVQIQKIFNNLDVITPTYDSISLRGFNIIYLTNNRNDALGEKDKKPYIVFLHDSGKNSSNFLDYFKNPKLSNNFHLIAIDRPGFGLSHPLSEVHDIYQTTKPKTEIDSTTHMFNNISLVDDVLENENEYLNGVRVIAHGNSCLYAVGSYTHMPLSSNRIHLFSPKFTHLNKIDLLFKKVLVSNFISWTLPNSFINKNKEIILNNEKLLNEMGYYFDNIRSMEKGYRNESHLMYRDFKALTFHLNKNSFNYDYSDNKKAIERIRIDNAFSEKDLLNFGYNDVYSNVSKTINHLSSDESDNFFSKEKDKH